MLDGVTFLPSLVSFCPCSKVKQHPCGQDGMEVDRCSFLELRRRVVCQQLGNSLGEEKLVPSGGEEIDKDICGQEDLRDMMNERRKASNAEYSLDKLRKYVSPSR